MEDDLRTQMLKETTRLCDTVGKTHIVEEKDIKILRNLNDVLIEKSKKREESLKIILGRDDDEIVADLEWVKKFFTHMGPQHSAWENGPLVWLVRFERFTLFNEPIPQVKTRSQVRAICFALGLKID
jgi:hypothetical protein